MKSEDIPVCFQTKEQIEALLCKQLNVDRVTIISGLELDAPLISSPHELSAELLNVDKQSEPQGVSMYEKCNRVKSQLKTALGFREALLCWEQWNTIHKEWLPFVVCFPNAIVDIHEISYVIAVVLFTNTCRLYRYPLNAVAGGNFRFAQMVES